MWWNKCILHCTGFSWILCLQTWIRDTRFFQIMEIGTWFFLNTLEMLKDIFRSFGANISVFEMHRDVELRISTDVEWTPNVILHIYIYIHTYYDISLRVANQSIWNATVCQQKNNFCRGILQNLLASQGAWAPPTVPGLDLWPASTIMTSRLNQLHVQANM